MKGKLRRFWSLGSAGWIVTGEALLLPFFIGAGFRTLGVPRTQAWLRRWTLVAAHLRPSVDPRKDIQLAGRVQRMIKRITGVSGSCLVRSMTLWAILLRRGIVTDLRVGFRKSSGKVEGHAWVEYQGVPLNETEAETRTFAVYAQPVHFDVWIG